MFLIVKRKKLFWETAVSAHMLQRSRLCDTHTHTHTHTHIHTYIHTYIHTLRNLTLNTYMPSASCPGTFANSFDPDQTTQKIKKNTGTFVKLTMNKTNLILFKFKTDISKGICGALANSVVPNQNAKSDQGQYCLPKYRNFCKFTTNKTNRTLL